MKSNKKQSGGGDVGGRKWLIGSLQRFFCLDCSAFHFFSLYLTPLCRHLRQITTETPGHICDSNQEHMVPRACLKVQFNAVGSPSLVPKWWSDLFSCPLSLAVISKSYCLLTARVLQVTYRSWIRGPCLSYVFFSLSSFALHHKNQLDQCYNKSSLILR